MESDHATTTTPALEKRLVYRAIKRVYDYERAGRITSHERDRLLARYRGELDQMNTFTAVTSPAPGGADNNNMSLFKRDLITILDQRIAQIGAGIDDLKKSIENGPAPRRVPDLDVGEEEKEEKKIDAAGSAKTVKKQKENEKEDTSTVHVPQKSDPLPAVDSVESSEGDSSLEDIKKQIMQTLSRLEQAEVE